MTDIDDEGVSLVVVDRSKGLLNVGLNTCDASPPSVPTPPPEDDSPPITSMEASERVTL